VSGSEREDDAELVSVSDAWAEAIVSNDADRIAGFMANDWVIVSETGISVRDDFLAVVRVRRPHPHGDGPRRRTQDPGLR